jgi:RES domain-containing protein
MPAYVLIPVDFNGALVTDLSRGKLPVDWRQSPPSPATQILGDTWVDQKESAILRVPSALVPEEYNYLFNPAHPDFGQLRIGTPQDYSVDPRLSR